MRNILKLIPLVVVSVISNPANAVRVTNLDTVPHTVIYEAAGSRSATLVPVGETIYIVGVPDGRLSLKTNAPKSSASHVQSDGLLADFIGGGRNQDIPVNDFDDFAIWPGEQLIVQYRRRNNGRS